MDGVGGNQLGQRFGLAEKQQAGHGRDERFSGGFHQLERLRHFAVGGMQHGFVPAEAIKRAAQANELKRVEILKRCLLDRLSGKVKQSQVDAHRPLIARVERDGGGLAVGAGDAPK